MWSNSKFAGSLREIITRATCAKGQKRFRQMHSVATGQPVESVLGYRVSGHAYVASPKTNSVEVRGHYDLHVWYAYADGTQTAVEKKTVSYIEYLPVVDLEGERLGVDEVVCASVIREPEITSVHARRGAVQVEVELEFYAEIIGETKLWVKVYEPPFADDKKGKDEIDLEDDDGSFDEDEFEEGDFDDDDDEFDEEEIEP